MNLRLIALTSILSTSIWGASAPMDDKDLSQHPTAARPVFQPKIDSTFQGTFQSTFKDITVHLESQNAVTSFIKEVVIYQDNPARYVALVNLQDEYAFICSLNEPNGIYADYPGGHIGRKTDIRKKIRDIYLGK